MLIKQEMRPSLNAFHMSNFHHVKLGLGHQFPHQIPTD